MPTTNTAKRKKHGGWRLPWRPLMLCIATSALLWMQSGVPLSAQLMEELRARLREQGIEFISFQHLIEPYYADVLAGWEEEGYERVQGVEIEINPWNYVASSEHEFPVQTGVGGRETEALLWEDEQSWLEWEVEVPESGLYNLQWDYYPLDGKRASIQRDIMINGEYPFNEAKRLLFYRTFEEIGDVRQDNQGNDLRRRQVEVFEWRTVRFSDPDGLYRDPFLFYLEEGTNRIRMEAIREPMAIASMKLVAAKTVPTYEEVLAGYEEQGYEFVDDVVLKVQAEETLQKASMTVRGEFGWDPLSEPYHYGYWRLNEFGSSKWRRGGEWASWRIEVPKSGLYKIGFRVWQGWSERLPSVRSVKIDGEYPAREWQELTFYYNRYWQMVVPSTEDGEPMLVYLEEGEHTLTMTPMVGPIRRTVLLIRDVTTKMAEMDREITMITGADVDPNRDWEIHRQIPDLLPRMQQLVERLEEEAEWSNAYAGQSRISEQLNLTAHILTSMIENPRSIPRRVDELATQQQSLSTWILKLLEPRLTVDYMVFADPEIDIPSAQATAMQRFRSTIENFLLSFSKDYTSIGSAYDDEVAQQQVEQREAAGVELAEAEQFGTTMIERIVEPGDDPILLELWVGRGREWALIIKEMIEETFTPVTGVHVNVNVIPANQLDVTNHVSVLLLNFASGNAPDLVMGANHQLPVEFAIRGGALNLNQFADYQQMITRFRSGALIPFHYEGGDYAVPETQGFNMMFYRIDILSELGMMPPQTWTDVIEMLPSLQQFDMNFNYESKPPGFTPILFQHEGDYYTDNGYYSALNTPEALAAFDMWTSFYAQYRIPIEADFYNRMRTGEMPVGVHDYQTYVKLSTAAPELTGWWRMEPIPGIRREDGTIDRTTGGWSDVSVIFSDTEHPEAAWQLMKWWTSEPIQTQYAREIEALIGVEARWNTSNMNALRNLPWPAQDIQAVEEQFLWFREMPVVLGGYFTDRHIKNAWNRVVLQGQKPREALEIAVKDIDRELRKKQEEFGIVAPPRERPATVTIPE